MRLLLFLVPLAVVAQTGTTSPPAAHPKTTATATSSTRSAVHRPATPGRTPAKPEAVLTTDDQKTIYALGLEIARSLGPFSLSAAEMDIVKRALTDAQAGKPAEDLETWGPKIRGLAQARTTQISQTTLAKAAAEPGAVKTSSGLIYRETQAGSGPSPSATDTVRVHYRGTLPDGTEFDSSYKRNAPAEFPLDHVIKCWTEGVQKMKVGGKATLVCPSDLAYGDRGQSGIPPNSVLTFQVELLAIVPATTPPAAPAAPAAPAPGGQSPTPPNPQ